MCVHSFIRDTVKNLKYKIVFLFSVFLGRHVILLVHSLCCHYSYEIGENRKHEQNPSMSRYYNKKLSNFKKDLIAAQF